MKDCWKKISDVGSESRGLGEHFRGTQAEYWLLGMRAARMTGMLTRAKNQLGLLLAV